MSYRTVIERFFAHSLPHAVVAVGLVLAIAAPPAQALEWSDVERVSNFGEPLEAQLQVSSLDPDDDRFQVRIATEAEYRAANITRPELLRDARIEVLELGDKARVRVLSQSKVQEPMGILLLKARTRDGEFSETFTLLFELVDLPTTDDVYQAPSSLPAKPVLLGTDGTDTTLALAAAALKEAAIVASTPERRGLAWATSLNLKPQRIDRRVDTPLLALKTELGPESRAKLGLSTPVLATGATPVPAAAPTALPPTSAERPSGLPTLLFGLSLLCFLLVGAYLVRRRMRRRSGRARVRSYSATRRRKSTARNDARAHDAAVSSASAARLRLQAAAKSAPTIPAAATENPPAPDETLYRGADQAALIPPASSFAEMFDGPLPAANTAAGPEFYSEVARLLRKALHVNPESLDLRYKLLEVSYTAGDVESFLENARQYAGVSSGQDDPAWETIAAMGRALVPQETLFHHDLSARCVKRSRHYDELLDAGLRPMLRALKDDYTRLANHSVYLKALQDLNRRDGGRPTPLVVAERCTAAVKGAQIWLKREDLRAPQESQRINAYGQVLLARQLGKKKVVASTRSGRHGFAVVAAAESLGLPVDLFVPQTLAADTEQALQRLAQRGQSPGVQITAVTGDARVEALRAWMQDPEASFYICGLDAGPPPYPAIVADLQAVIGLEARRQLLPHAASGVLAAVCARDTGPSGLGFLQPFLDADETQLHSVAAAETPARTDGHYFWREHAWLRASGRVRYDAPSADSLARAASLAAEDALPQDATNLLALARALELAASGSAEQAVVVLLTNPEDGPASV